MHCMGRTCQLTTNLMRPSKCNHLLFYLCLSLGNNHMNCILETAETTTTWISTSAENSPSKCLILAANGPWQIPTASFAVSAAETIPCRSSSGWEDAAGLGSCAVENVASKGWGQQFVSSACWGTDSWSLVKTKQLQNVKSESSESTKTNLKELNNKNPL